ncbi:pirin family protein [Nonlabens marinus]|uniref:Possible Pirin family proteins n=1 Tax=Nonlabens marinus S1-08 TaxID=1454201 RepID=W8VZX8_9FLAO|nr:pirin family protein [Nonlabens marinus]BAO55351.1 possible Pirin family proteins [Nonlabens marinus S1-08]
MKKTIHPAESRGHANHGWLKANHSFSFASWYDPARIHFGAIRVLNDDTIAPGAGFPTHPHDNMEIITIPLSGILEHKDSMGNVAQIKTGEVQVMSAGTGVTHSEYNGSQTEELKLFQIWLFPNKKDVTPRYDELKLNIEDRKNKFQQILSPSPDDDGVWIHQQAWMHMISMEANTDKVYQFKSTGSGVYVMVISGTVEIDGTTLKDRDAIGVWDADQFKVTSKESAELLLIEVPMEL